MNITVEAVIDGPLGALTLDGSNAAAYELHTDTTSEQQVSWRKQEAANGWTEGTFVTSAVRENVIETLAVWVNADTYPELHQRVYELTRRLEQLSYTVALTIEGVTSTWTCFPADFSVKMEQAFHHSATALVTAQVPRLPSKTLTSALGTVQT